MYKLKEYLKAHDKVWEIVKDRDLETDELLDNLKDVDGRSEFLKRLNDYLDEYW